MVEYSGNRKEGDFQFSHISADRAADVVQSLIGKPLISSSCFFILTQPNKGLSSAVMFGVLMSTNCARDAGNRWSYSSSSSRGLMMWSA